MPDENVVIDAERRDERGDVVDIVANRIAAGRRSAGAEAAQVGGDAPRVRRELVDYLSPTARGPAEVVQEDERRRPSLARHLDVMGYAIEFEARP